MKTSTVHHGETFLPVWSVTWLPAGALLKLAQSGNRPLECRRCGFIGAAASTFGIMDLPGERTCPSCSSREVAPLDLDWANPYRVCAHCQHVFFLDDAVAPDAAAGNCVCPRCVQTT